MCRPKLNAFLLTLQDLDTLTPLQKRILEERYIRLVTNFEQRCFYYAILFHTCRILVTIGSLIVPALLSIQYTDTHTTTSSNLDPQDFAYQIYWATWVVSLLVTTSNGIFTLFKIDKKYYFLHSTLEQLRSEGWQYLELSGRFSGFYTPNEKVTHSNQFLFFCHTVEKIKMRQVQEEYWKLAETQTAHSKDSVTTATTKNTSIVPISIDSSHPEPSNEVIPVKSSATHMPTFLTEGLLPPTPLNPTLQQLLQVLTVDGLQAQIQNQSKTETTAKVPVQSKLPSASTSDVSILRQTSDPLRKTESFVRVGTEIPAPEVESKPQTSENT